jgi:two-component system NtrC family sensor kinase
MSSLSKILKNNNTIHNISKRYLHFSSSIFGRVVFIIILMSVFLFASFGIIFKSVYKQYLNTTIHQNGNNVGSIVEGALYYSMLENDKSSLQNTLDVIKTMSGIDDVNMYDKADSLIYSSHIKDTIANGNPNCLACHKDLKSLFPGKQKSYKIIDKHSNCVQNQSDINTRHLLIRSPILNQRSCYTSSCHAHNANEEVLGSLIIKIPLKEMDGAIKKASTDFYLLATFTTLLLLSILIFFTLRKIKNPLQEIIVASKAVAHGDLNTRLKIDRNQLDDIRMVSYAFNNMLDNLNAANIELQNWSQQLEYKVQKNSEELLEAQNELIHIERIASLGKLSSSVAHEINNPLSGVLTYTKLIQKQLGKTEIDPTLKESMLKHLKVIETETKRCGEIVKGLLEFSKKDQENSENLHMNKLIKDTYDLMAHQMKMSNIIFNLNLLAVSDLAYCSENQIKQACIALLVNASEAITENGEISLKTSNPDQENIKIEITDNGYGISPQDLPHVFEPFFSGKHKESGIGLGLAITHGIVKSHQGRIEIDSKPGKGTTISITLPLLKK